MWTKIISRKKIKSIRWWLQVSSWNFSLPRTSEFLLAREGFTKIRFTPHWHQIIGPGGQKINIKDWNWKKMSENNSSSGWNIRPAWAVLAQHGFWYFLEIFLCSLLCLCVAGRLCQCLSFIANVHWSARPSFILRSVATVTFSYINTA